MRIRTQPLFNNYNKYGYIDSTYIAIARPGKRLLGVLNGVDENSCRLEINLNNTAVLTFNVYRMVDGKVSSYYDRIEQLMELELPSVGWFKINEEPIISGDGNKEVMSVRAESLEIELAQYFIKGMEINMGSSSSAEMLAVDNTYDAMDGSDSKFSWANIKFYRDTAQLEVLVDMATDSWTKQDIINRLSDYPCLYNSWRITYNLGSVNEAITNCSASISDEERSKALASYEDRIKSQQSIYFLTQSYPELIPYLEVADVDLSKPSDENTDNGSSEYTVKEMLQIELQREKGLSLLDLILDETGWTVGFVDDSVMSDSDEEDDLIPLKDKVGRFEISSSNVYNFLMQEASQYFRCIFVYDTINKTVNCYNVNNLGVDTNIFINFSNIQNSVERTNDDKIMTVFHVAGGDDMNVTYANLGYNTIIDLSYYMNTDHFDQETIDKYYNWLDYREELRHQFMDLAVQYFDKLEEIEYIEDRVPVDGADATQYTSFSDEELIEERAKYEGILAGIKSYYVDENNDFSISALMNNQEDYAEYLYITTVILSNPLGAFDMVYFDPVTNTYEVQDGGTLGQIDLVLLNRKIANGGFVNEDDDETTRQKKTDYKQQKEYLDNYEYDFQTYGISYGLNEINVRIDDLRNKITTLWSRGCTVDPDDVPDDEEDPEQYQDEYHRNKYELYEKYQTALAQAETVLAERQEESTTARNELQDISNQMNELTRLADISNEINGFTHEELELMKEYYVHTDYVNENFIITDIYTSQEIINTENQLIKYATEELYASSHPQYRWTTSQDNLYLMPEFKPWHNQLDIGNYITIGMYPKPEEGAERNNINYFTKLRVVSIGLNPFMVEQDIDITFSSIVQYKSKQNDFVDLFELNNGVGDNQINAYSNSKHLDGSYSIDSSFLIKLLQGGMKTYIDNSTAESTMQSYDNLIGPVRTANDWIINSGATGREIIDAWMLGGETGDTTISGGNLVTNAIYAKNLAINNIVSSNYVPEANSNFSQSGSYWNLLNGNFISPGFSVINTNNGTEDNPDWDSNAYFRGEINAMSGRIGGDEGWVITDNKIYSNPNASGSTTGSVELSTVDFSRTITGVTNPITNLRFAVGSNFAVGNDGTVYSNNLNATGVHVSGEISATDGKIGGWDISSSEITATNSQGNSVYLRNATNQWQDVLVVKKSDDSYPFYLHADGFLHAENAEITGTINATGGTFSNTITCTGTISGGAISGATLSVGKFGVDANGNVSLNTGGISSDYNVLKVYDGQGNVTNISPYVIQMSGSNNKSTTINPGIVSSDTISGGALSATGTISGASLTTTGSVTCDRIYVDHLSTGSQPQSGLTACGAGGAQGQIHLMSSSSIRYKNINRVITNNDIEKLYNIPVYEFTYKDGYLVDNDERNGIAMPGFIAEDWDSVMTIAVNHLDDGSPEMWNSNIVVPLMFQMIKNEHERNDKLRAEVEELKQLVKQLTERK